MNHTDIEVRWENLSRETQDLYVRLLWNDGYSEGAIANFLHTTKGRVVRRRQSHLKDLSSARAKAGSHAIGMERFRDLLDLHEMREMEKAGVTPIAPVGESAKPPQARPHVCKWPMPGRSLKGNVVCGKTVVEGEEFCEEHLAIVRKYR